MIGGEWRGRKINFRTANGLRPTGDRIRETVFNWVQSYIEGADTLDLFAGSGALSFEAMSRGSKLSVMVDQNYATVRQLQAQVARFNAEKVVIWHGKAEDYLSMHQHEFDLIFVDPPFAEQSLYGLLNRIANGSLVKPNGVIYVEYPANTVPEIPRGWTFLKQKKNSDVGYGLLTREENSR